MNDATDIINSILAELPAKNDAGVVVTTQHEYTGVLLPIDTETSKRVISAFLGKLPVKIGVGGRYGTSLRYAGLLRACGYSAVEIKKLLIKFDKDKNSPVKGDTTDIDKIVEFVAKRPAGFRERKISKPAPAIVTAPDIQKEAKELYERGGFIEYCETAFNKVWYGDAHILRGILYVEAVARVSNAQFGVHLHISGDTQSGKSQSVKKALKFLHPNDKLSRTFSMKYLFYAPPDILHRNTVIFSDDTEFDEETARFFRGILTSWEEGSERGVVDNQKARDLKIPPRVSVILTSIDDVCQETDDAQDESRFMTLEIKRSAQDITAIKKFVQESHPDISHELAVIHAVWEMIPETIVTRHEPISDDTLTMREFYRYLEIIMAHALLCNRTTTTTADYDAVQKFLANSKAMVNSTTAALTRKEAAVRCILTEDKQTVADISKKTGMSIQNVYLAVRGRDGTFQNPRGGLMKKEPKLVYTRKSSPGENDVHELGVRK